MRSSNLTAALLLSIAIGLGCSSNGSNNNPDTGASNDAGSANFTAVAPCATQASYTAGTAITFPGSTGFAYAPKCLKVSKGGFVTFAADSGANFAMHPLAPSARRGDLTANPITATSGTTTTATFTFPNAGFFAYFCTFHGSADDGTNMAGVIWVE